MNALKASRRYVQTIPAGYPFARTLAANLLDEAQGRPEFLARSTILLPTRRACRVLRECFLDISGGKPVLLPRLTPIGDVDEGECEPAATCCLAEPDALDPDAPLRDQMDLDSMDLLNLVIRLNEVLGVEVPERDYPRLDSVSHAVAYLEGALSARG